MGGTAYAADVIITSPDELGDDVVTQRSTADDAIGTSQIKDRAVTQLREAHPHLRARVAVNGAGQTTLLAGDVNTLTGLKRIEKGVLRVTFDTQNTLGAGTQPVDVRVHRDAAGRPHERHRPAEEAPDLHGVPVGQLR